MNPSRMSFAGVRSSVILVSVVVLSNHGVASAADIVRCAHLRDGMRAAQMAQRNATGRLQDMKPRLDALNKQIDALSIKEANDYSSGGLVNPDTERQLTQLRTEYKKLAQPNQDTIKAAKRAITTYQEQMQSEGCPTENASSSAKPPPPKVSSDSQPLDTSGMSGQLVHELIFLGTGQQLRLHAPADYGWVRVDGTAQAPPFFQNGYTVKLDCPLRTSTSATQNVYECNVSMEYYGTKTGSFVALGSAAGRAHVVLTPADNYKSALTIDFQSVAVKDATHNPPQRIERGGHAALHEVKPLPPG